MSGHRADRHGSRRTGHERNEHPSPVAVRHADGGRYELALSPGAGVPDLVAAAGILPHDVVYTAHRPAPPGEPAAAILVFRAPPADPGGQVDPGGVPAHPAPGGGPSPLASRLPEPEVDTGPEDREPATALDEALEDALGALVTPAAFATHGCHLVHDVHGVHDLTRHDPDAPLPAASAAARHAPAA